MMHFPLFQISPLFSKNFQTAKFSKFDLFPKYLSIFIRQNFWWPFISHRPQISNFPPFSLFQYIFPPVSQKLLFPLCLRKIHLLFTYLMCISFPPYFDHDAFMHHPMHVLDAPGNRRIKFLILWPSGNRTWTSPSIPKIRYAHFKSKTKKWNCLRDWKNNYYRCFCQLFLNDRNS